VQALHRAHDQHVRLTVELGEHQRFRPAAHDLAGDLPTGDLLPTARDRTDTGAQRATSASLNHHANWQRRTQGVTEANTPDSAATSACS
jgi:hypothetical protein